MKRAGQLSDNFESEGLPQGDGPLICAHYEIKLHCAEASLAGAVERMRAHGASDAPACRPGSRDVTTIGYVRAAALLIGLKKIRAENLAIFLCDENFVLSREPVVQSVLARQILRQRVCLARANRWLQDRPNRIGVSGL